MNAVSALRSDRPGNQNRLSSNAFNGRFRDECLNEHWFTSLAHVRRSVETWQHEYSDDPKKGFGRLTPALMPGNWSRNEYRYRRTLNRSATESGGIRVAPILFRDVATEQAGLMERS